MKGLVICIGLMSLILLSTPQSLAVEGWMVPVITLITDSSTEDKEWPINDGRYGVPTSTFTLPVPNAGNGIYYPNVQASFPLVDWQTLDRLYIPAGHYPYIRIGNLPVRSANSPLVITNKGGQVRVGGLGHYYMMALGGGSNWVLTGRYDPISLTGDSDYPGHRGGNFAHSQDTYGLLLDDAFVRESISGLGVGSQATNFELEYIEIRRVGFAGMSLKTDDDGTAHMSGVSIHDCYIHDIKSEGIYAGSTQTQPQHQLRDWKVYNNRILRTGTEALQLGQLAGSNEVFNNVIGPAAIDWRASFQPFQDSNFQIGIREGELNVHNNIFIGSANTMISLFAGSVAGDSTASNVGVKFTDNYFSGMRFLGMYMNPTALAGMSHVFEGNTFRNWRFERDEVYPGTAETNHVLRIANNSTPVSLLNNTWSAPVNLSNGLASGNGVSGNISGSGNTKSESPSIQFCDSGLPTDFDYLKLEMWTDVATLNDDEPVSYQRDDLVMHLAIPYQCSVNTCASGLEPNENPSVWSPLSPLADDVRVEPRSIWKDLGLTPSLISH